VHVRSYVPCALALPWVELRGVPLLFDMRGLWADERVEAGTWSEAGRIYRGAKLVERLLLARADAITTLTLRLKRYLREEYPHSAEVRAPIRVIPTCVDLEHFHPEVPPNPEVQRALAGANVLLYLGAIGPYYLPREMAEFYLAFRRTIPESSGTPSRKRASQTKSFISPRLATKCPLSSAVPRRRSASSVVAFWRAMAARRPRPAKCWRAGYRSHRPQSVTFRRYSAARRPAYTFPTLCRRRWTPLRESSSQSLERLTS
jgi:hypothetical protein